MLSLLPLTPSLSLTPSCSHLSLSLPGSPWVPGTFLGPQEALGAFTSLWQPWVFSQTQGPCFPCSPSTPLLPLAPSHPLSLPGFPWVPEIFLGPQEALPASASLWQPCQNWVFSQTQGPCFPCSHSPPSLPLTPSHPMSLPMPPWIPGTFLGPREALGAFRSLWQPWVFSQTQGPCFPCSLSLPLTPSCSLSLPRPPWVPGTFLGPWEAFGAFTSLWQPWVFSQTQGPCFPCFPSPPLTPSHPLLLLEPP